MSRASDEVGSLVQLGRPHDAAARAAELLPSNPDDTFLLLNAALAWSKIGAADEARKAIDQAIALDTDEPESFRVGSIVYGRIGRRKEAYRLAERAVELRPSSASCHRQRAHTGAALKGRSVLAAAERSAHEAIRLAPNEAESHNCLGAVYMARTNHKQAIDAFRRALEITPNEAVYHQNIAKSLAATGNKREASEHLLAAGRADPTSDEPIKAMRQLTKVGAPVLLVVLAANAVRAAVTSNDDPTTTSPPLTVSIPAIPTFPAIPTVPAMPTMPTGLGGTLPGGRTIPTFTSPSFTSPPFTNPPATISTTVAAPPPTFVAEPATNGMSTTSLVVLIVVIVALVAALATVVGRSLRRDWRNNRLHPDAKRALAIDKEMRKAARKRR